MKRKTIELLWALVLLLGAACTQEYGLPTSDTDDTQESDGSSTVNSDDFAATVAAGLAANCASHEAATDYVWQAAEAVLITLDGNAITVGGNGATASGSVVTISSAGTYRLSGTLNDGQVTVDTEDEGVVRLILDGAHLHCDTSAPLLISNAEKTVIILADQSQNTLSDGSSYVFPDSETDEPNAALFSKDDLSIGGTGSLTVDANYADGITSKDGLVIHSGTISVTSADDAIRGKDYLIVETGVITVHAGGDGLKSDNDEDTDKGFVVVQNGEFTIVSGRDAVQAKTDVLIADGRFSLTSGGGSNARLATGATAKGLKAVVNTVIDGGAFTVRAADDALHANGNLVINDGTFDIASGDDAIHADQLLVITGGQIDIGQCYEGIESQEIQIDDGDIRIKASDDGLNGAGGTDGSGADGGWPGQPPSSSSNYLLTINGGRIAINAAGDGIDVNGSIVMTGGVVLVHGPTQNMNGALDYDRSFTISGGLLIAAGSAGMAQAPGSGSSQKSLLVNFYAAKSAGSLVHLQDGDGRALFTFAPSKSYQSIAFSSPQLTQGTSYRLYTGGSATGAAEDGLYGDGTYSPGTLSTQFTVSSVVTRFNSQ